MRILDVEGIDSRISYWADIWRELCESIENRNLCIELINPHMLIQDIIEEYEFNKFRNKRNLLFFIYAIEGFLKENLIVKHFFVIEYKKLKGRLENRDYEGIYSLCQQISKLLTERKYAHIAFEMLRSIFMRREKVDDYKKIKKLSLELITEFIINGHSLLNIRSYVYNVFDLKISTDEIDIPFVNKIIYQKYKMEDFIGQEVYEKALSHYMDKLSVEDRIELFGNYINKEKVRVDYFFKAIGIKITGKEKFYCLDNCVAYDPFSISYLNDKLDDNKRFELFTFGFEMDVKNNFSIIKVSILKTEDDFGTSMNKFGYEEAYEQALSFFNILRVVYGTTEFDSYLMSRVYFWTTGNGNICASFGIDYKNAIEENPTMICSERMSNISDLLDLASFYKAVSSEKINLINRSILAYAKGMETRNIEDKLLQFWICIENLIMPYGSDNKYDIVQTTVTNAGILFLRTEILKDLFSFIKTRSCTEHQIFGYEEEIELPENLAEKFGMLENQVANYSVFKENVKEIEKYTTRVLIIERIESVYNFYNDNTYTIRFLRREELKIKNELLYIYKYRNQIVHNGYVNRSILPHIIDAAQKHAKHLLLLFIASFALYNLDVVQTVEKINMEKEHLFSGLNEQNYFDVKFELFTDTNLFFD